MTQGDVQQGTDIVLEKINGLQLQIKPKLYNEKLIID